MQDFMQSLKEGDKVHIYDLLYKDDWPPVGRGIITRVTPALIEARTEGIKTGDKLAFQRAAKEHRYRLAPYSEERELARRVEQEKVARARELSCVCWESLPLDVLDEIGAILRENGAIP